MQKPQKPKKEQLKVAQKKLQKISLPTRRKNIVNRSLMMIVIAIWIIHQEIALMTAIRPIFFYAESFSAATRGEMLVLCLQSKMWADTEYAGPEKYVYPYICAVIANKI